MGHNVGRGGIGLCYVLVEYVRCVFSCVASWMWKMVLSDIWGTVLDGGIGLYYVMLWWVS